jgi:hypothetical protein
MVCDPVTAFAVACNVLQVIELGMKALSRAAAYRKSEGGALKEQQELQDVSQSLNSLNNTLLTSITEDQNSIQSSSEQLRLAEANGQCLRLSRELIDFLEDLKLRNRHSVLDSIRISMKTMWHKDRMDAMEKAVAQARDNLIVAFLVYMKYASKCVTLEVLTT